MSEKPLISIIIPVFNRAHLIGQTLDSVISQSYNNWECIIVDDGSTNETLEAIKKYIDIDNRFFLHKRPKEKPKGANACRNYGFEKAKGAYINWFDSDDIMHVDFLKLKLEALEQNSSLDFCACINTTFKENINRIVAVERPPTMNSNNYIEDYLLNGLYFYTPSPMWHFNFLKNKKLFDETLHRSQETDFHFRMLTFSPKFLYLNTVLFHVRVGGDSVSKESSKSKKAKKSIFKYFNGVFNYLKGDKEIKNREKLMCYVFYRQTTNYYNINQLNKDLFQRLNIFMTHSKYLMIYLFSSKLLKKHIFKTSMGLLIVLVINKGYKYFYYPEYDYINKDD